MIWETVTEKKNSSYKKDAGEGLQNFFYEVLVMNRKKKKTPAQSWFEDP